MSISHTPKSIVPVVFMGQGGLGWLMLLYVKAILRQWFGRELAEDLCVALIAADADQGTRTLSLPVVGEQSAVTLAPGEQFITRPYLVRDLRRSGLRDPLLARRAGRIPENFDGDTATGSAKDRHIARMIVAAQHREFDTLQQRAFAKVRDRDRIARLRAAGITPLLDQPTVFICGFNLFGGFGVGSAPDLGVMAGHHQQQQGFVNARRWAIGGAPECAGSEIQARANLLAFRNEVALSHLHPGQYVSRGFGGRAVTTDGPTYTDFVLVSHTNSRIVAQDRESIALRMAYAALSLVVGDVAAMIESRAQDARRHLADAPDARQRFMARCGVAATGFSRAALLESASDELAATVSEYLLVGAS